MAMKHIDLKDLADDISRVVGYELLTSKQKVLALSYLQLGKYNNLNPQEWGLKQNALLNAYFSKVEELTKQERKRVFKAFVERSKRLGLTKSQQKIIRESIGTGYQDLLNTAIQEYKRNVSVVQAQSQILESNVAKPIIAAVNQHIQSNADYGIVEYKNGRHYKWDSYMEMKLRTELQKDISDNLVRNGASTGVVFYIAAYYGDCADDHVALNGAIVYDEDYATINPDRAEEIEAYIKSNKLMSIQEAVGEAGNYFTTRPNCRHFFSYISIDQVLGIKSKDDLMQVREDQDLNFKGEYKPEKYKALTEQRNNERAIRQYKQRVEVAEQRLADMPSGAPVEEINKLKNYISKNEANVRNVQARQRALIKSNKGLVREYEREKVHRL